jgi:hypothetical protein
LRNSCEPQLESAQPTDAPFEIFLGIITRQAIRRGTHRSVRELVEAIGRFIDGWNDRCEPFVGTKPPTRSSPTPAQVQEPPSRDASPMANR